VADYRLRTSLFVARDLEETFAFFAAAENLQQLTPPWLRFRILTPQPIDMHRGTVIDYRIWFRGIPIPWRTEIVDWDPPHRFLDRQLRGPYLSWDHTHTFTAVDGGTLVEDRVRYQPIGGRWAHRLRIRHDLERIFEYRQHATLKALGVEARDPISVTIERKL
jgi:ligand-binding SRPBCC domain-containing protein